MAVVMLVLVVQNQAIVQPSHLFFKVHYKIRAVQMMQINYRKYIVLLTIKTKYFNNVSY